jgi:prophage regulatory protein
MQEVPSIKEPLRAASSRRRTREPRATGIGDVLRVLESPNEDSIIRRRDVKALTQLSYRTLDRLIAAGRFPAPVSLTGARAVGWRSSEIRHWIATRPTAIDSATTPHRAAAPASRGAA